MITVLAEHGCFVGTSSEALTLQSILQVQSRATGLPQPPFAPANAASVPTSAILPHLRSILHQNVMQRDQIVNLLNYVSQGGTLPDHHLSTLGSRSSSLSVAENLKYAAVVDNYCHDTSTRVARFYVPVLGDSFLHSSLTNTFLRFSL
eukprot:Gb_18422 [translate_table: standard]